MARTTRPLPTISPSESSTSCICGDDALICNCEYVPPTGAALIALIKRTMPRSEENIAYLTALGTRPKLLAALERNMRRAKLILRRAELEADVQAEIAA